MRYILILIFFAYETNAQVQPNRNGYVHPLITVQSGTPLTNVNLEGYKGNDTFVITQNTNSWLLQQDSGLSWDQPLVFINASGKKIRVNGGVASENCQYIKIIGFGSDSAYGFEFRGGGIGGNFSGMYKGLLIEGVRFTGSSQGPLWVKSEAPHACDFYNYWKNQPEPRRSMYMDPYKYLAPNFQDSVWIKHCWIDSSGGDTYLGSTGSINGREPVPCLNNQVLPTMQTRNFHFDSNYVNYLGRSGVQLSLAVAGNNTMNDNIITNCGYEWPETQGDAAKFQGAGIRVSGGDKNVEVARNWVKYTNLYNYDIASADVNFHDNYGDSVGYVVYHGAPYFGGQALPSTIFSAGTTQTIPLKILNNQMYHTTGGNNIAYAVYGGKNFNQLNVVCNNIGKLQVLSTPFNYTTDCGGYDTTWVDTTVTVTHDTLVVFHIPERYEAHDTAISYIDSVAIIPLKYKKYTRAIVLKTKIYTYFDTIPAHDSVGICGLCATHDSTYQVPVLSSIPTQNNPLNDFAYFTKHLNKDLWLNRQRTFQKKVFGF